MRFSIAVNTYWSMRIVLWLASAIAVISAFQISEPTSVGYINWPFTVCEDGPWQIDALLFSNYPSKNTELVIYAIGKTLDKVDFDHVELDVKINGVSVYNETIPFKKSFVKGDAVAFEQDNKIPDYSPSGTYVDTYSFRDSANRPLGCFFFVFKI